MGTIETVELIGSGGRVKINKDDYISNPDRWAHYRPVDQKNMSTNKSREEVFLEGVLAADTGRLPEDNPYEKKLGEYQSWKEGFKSIRKPTTDKLKVESEPESEPESEKSNPEESTPEKEPEIKASKAAVKLAEVEQISLRDIPYSGLIITVEDVRAYADSLE